MQPYPRFKSAQQPSDLATHVIDLPRTSSRNTIRRFVMPEADSPITRHPIVAGVVATVVGGLLLAGILRLWATRDDSGPGPTSSATASSPTTAGGADSGVQSLFLADVPQANFVLEAQSPSRSSASINGKNYPSSYWYRFTNCGGCTETDELNIEPIYSRFVGTVGLTDDSRHDDVIDGTLTFEIYANDKRVFGPQSIEYGDKFDFDAKLTNASRIRLVVRDGDNGEFPCWCSARFE